METKTLTAYMFWLHQTLSDVNYSSHVGLPVTDMSTFSLQVPKEKRLLQVSKATEITEEQEKRSVNTSLTQGWKNMLPADVSNSRWN